MHPFRPKCPRVRYSAQNQKFPALGNGKGPAAILIPPHFWDPGKKGFTQPLGCIPTLGTLAQ